MGELHYSTEITLDGPWLLDAKALKDFDSIIAKHWDQLEKRRNNLLEESVNIEEIKINQQTTSGYRYFEQIELYRQKNPIYSKSIKQIRIYYEHSNYDCENFDSAFQDISLTYSIPLGFTVYISSGDIDCQVSLRDEDGLKIFATPEESEHARNLFTELGNWAQQNYAPWWQRWWEKLAKKKLLFYVYLGVIAVVLAFINNFIRLNISVLDSQKKAQALLETGITDKNIPEALALLLKVQIIDRFSVQFYPLSFVIFGLLIFGVIFSIRPKIVLGIGRGSDRLKLWKRWLTFISVAVPGFVLTFIVLPKFADWLAKVLNIP